MKGRLLALSSAAVLTIYTAGYARTRSAAELLEAEERRPPMPRPGNVDRTPIPATPSDPVTRPVAPAAPAAPRVDGNSAVPVPVRVPAATERSAQPEGARTTSAAPSGVPSQAPQIARAETPSAVVAEGGLTPAVVPAAVASEIPSAPAPSTPAPAAPALAKWKDGKYTGWGRSRHGDLQATIWIEGGRISTSSISQCETRYPCDWIIKLPGQVVARQSAEVDYVSGATESATAFYYAVLEALSKAAQ